jgi:hypothetical protein
VELKKQAERKNRSTTCFPVKNMEIAHAKIFQFFSSGFILHDIEGIGIKNAQDMAGFCAQKSYTWPVEAICQKLSK